MNDKTMDASYKGELVLSDFNGAEVMTIPRDDGQVRGIFIPFGINGLYCNRKGRTTAYIRIVPKSDNIYGQTHLMQVSATWKRREEMKRLGYEPPIIGNFTRGDKKKVILDFEKILKR